jgi:hypothetical protein
MNKNKAIAIIEETFDKAFDKDTFIRFVKNLLNDIEDKNNDYWGPYIKEAFQSHISRYSRIGKYTDPEGEELDVLVIEVTQEDKLNKARTSLRNFVIEHLNTFGGKDYALAAFYSKSDGGRNWRFSFIKLEHQTTVRDGKIKQQKEFTPARRYSFLVGEDEKSHTAKRQLLPLLQNVYNNPLIEDIEKAFSIEVVTDEFFEQYQELFSNLSESLETNVELTKDLASSETDIQWFAKKMLGQIIFLYFLQKKGWLGVQKGEQWGSGEKNFLQLLYNKADSEGRNFFNDYLRYLFYEALAYPHGEDDYYQRFGYHIPFLNGGLFEANYEWHNYEIHLPNDLFHNDKEKNGDRGTGILDVFNRYNFTIREDELLEKEVAIDPEMLGKVFEKLLPIKKRKEQGTFYTPPEIVHYMSQESLIHYLFNSLKNNVSRIDIERFIQKGIFFMEHDTLMTNKGRETYQLPESIRQNVDLIDNLLTNIKICDPAIGSGAFPMGLLHEIFSAKQVLYAIKNGSLDGFQASKVKLNIIQNSIYGVDMEKGAVDIARLRFWLSLIIDEEFPQPLPNLDYKIVVGDSLISRFEKDMINIEWNRKSSVGKADEYVKKLQSTLKTLIDKQKHFFLPGDTNEKGRLKGEIRNLTLDILVNQVSFNKELYRNKNVKTNSAFSLSTKDQKRNQRIDLNIEKFNQIIAKLQELKDNPEQPLLFFDWKLSFPEIMNSMLTENPGFDIVIGNPPFVEHKKLKGTIELLTDYDVHSGQSDLSVFFIEKGLCLSKENSILMFITTNKFFNTGYGKFVRRFLLRHQLSQMINFEQVEVFKDVLVSSVVLGVIKNLPHSDEFCYHKYFKLKHGEFMRQFISDIRGTFGTYRQSLLDESEWSFSDMKQLTIKTNIERAGQKLSLLNGIAIYRGITTGYNPAFIIDEDKRNEMIIADKNNEEIIKPLLQGRNIRKWIYNENNDAILQTGFSTDIKKKYPIIFDHLCQFQKELEMRADQGKHWWNLRACKYYPEFERSEKIIWGLTADKWAYAYDDRQHYLPSNGYILTSENIPIKYLLALLNSNIMKYYFGFIGVMTPGGAYTLKHATIQQLPIAISEKQQIFITLVNYIIFLKLKYDDSVIPMYYENIIDACVYELYFPKEIHAANKGVIEHLNDLRPIDNSMTDDQKLAIINREFERLYDPYHPVRNNVETIENIETIRIIKSSIK